MIRKANVSDCSIVANLILELLDELNGNKLSIYSIDSLMEMGNSLISTNDIIAFIAENNGEPIGIVILNGCASLYAGRFGEITEIFVKPKYRSLNIGKQLITAAITFAMENKWSRLEVGTPEQPTWDRTLQFYKNNGFIETGVRLKLPILK